MKEILKAQNLRKTFFLSAKQRKIEKTDERKKVALDGLTFSAYQGEIFGLLGPNGAGKTTTLRILSTLIKADSGEAWIDGINVREQPDRIRQIIGFLTSELRLEDFFTPDYLFDFFSSLHHVSPQIAAKRKKELFSEFGIDRFAEVRVSDLSTGMRQKTALVISIVHDPEFIIFDEPTDGLDIITARTVTDFLLNLKSEGKTVILSTHDFSLVNKLCDRVGIIMDGKMALEGSMSEITKSESLEDVFFDLYGREQASI